MKKFSFLIVIAVTFCSCQKDDDKIISQPAAEALYKTEIRLQWASPAFTIPANAHFTAFAGMIHHKDSFLWTSNGLATLGLENVAEVGNPAQLNVEMAAIISKGSASYKFEIPSPGISGIIDTSFRFTLQHSCISFASMIAPSPDWFVGLNQYNLLQENKWINEVTVPLYLFDAGTEDGDVFGYNNPPSVPQQPVRLLTPSRASVLANGNSIIAAIGYVKFTRL
jgi:hypothetical protein